MEDFCILAEPFVFHCFIDVQNQNPQPEQFGGKRKIVQKIKFSLFEMKDRRLDVSRIMLIMIIITNRIKIKKLMF